MMQLGNSHQIFTKTHEDYSTTKKILVENNPKFFIYTLPPEKKQSILSLKN